MRVSGIFVGEIELGMARKRGRQDKGVAGPGSSTPATADAPIPTTPPRPGEGAVETPATPAMPEPNRAKRAIEEINWELVAIERAAELVDVRKEKDALKAQLVGFREMLAKQMELMEK